MDETCKAYRVPFRLHIEGQTIVLTNTSNEPLPWVRVEIAANALWSPLAPGRMAAQESKRIRVGGLLHSPDAALMVTWLRDVHDGPYIWRAVL